MGSKNLKAIAVRGTKMPEMANPDGLKPLQKWLTDNPKRWASLHQYGTGAPAQMVSMQKAGNVPTRNFRDGDMDVSGITAGAMLDTYGVGMEGCYACAVRCKKVVKIDEPDMKVDPAYGGAEYETLAAMGSCCGIGDLKAIAKAHELCGAYSLDTISCGVTIAFGMECFENGLLTNQDTGGIDLRFGNSEALVKVIDLIARREGIGDLLAEGSMRAAQKIGKGAEQFAMNVKGLEVPMHDPRAKASLGLGYEVNPHGADHCMNTHDTAFVAPGPLLNSLHPLGILDPLPAGDLSPKKVTLFRYWYDYRMLADCLTFCMFLPFSLEQYVDMVKAATGWDTGMVEMLKIAERTLTLERMFNLREGLSIKDDKLPDRYFQAHKNGPVSDKKYNRDDWVKARKYYYSLMGWDENGVPTQDTLEALGLEWAASA
jgi:aldehyde:ferredoxin oxidoreductase